MKIMITSSIGILTTLCGISAVFFLLEKKTQWKLFKYFPPLVFIYCVPAMLSNIPFADGSYILPYLLPREMAVKYNQLNRRYGSYFLLALIALHFLGVPIFETLWKVGETMLNFVAFV